MALDEMKCEPCRGGIPPLTDSEIDLYYRQLLSWSVVEKDGIKRLEKSFKFKDFCRSPCLYKQGRRDC
jgi:4a-hydroxytetrahydrobiopterin dehydratase